MINLKNILNEDSDVGQDFLMSDEYREMYKYLKKWVQKSTPEVADYLYKNFAKYKKLVADAPANFGIQKRFVPETPNGTTLYRGLTKPSKDLIKFAKEAKGKKEKFEKIILGGRIWYKYNTPIKYTPNLKCQSWTSDGMTASQVFTSHISMREGKYKFRVMMCTEQDDNFLFNSTFLSIINIDEEEIIHFGKEYPKGVYLMIAWDETR
jgi:hypothetical protein